jgi:hypothetical protein
VSVTVKSNNIERSILCVKKKSFNLLLESLGIPLLSNPDEIAPNDVFSKVYSANVPAKKLAKS